MGAAWPGGGGRWWNDWCRCAAYSVTSRWIRGTWGRKWRGYSSLRAPDERAGVAAARGVLPHPLPCPAPPLPPSLCLSRQDWQVRYPRGPPPTPRFDVNVPDLYIPAAMAFITYLLVAGLALGTQNRFSLDLLSLLASLALAWLIVEVLAVLLGLYLVAVNSELTPIDLVTFSGYKYIGMIAGLLAGLVFGKTGYYTLLSWCCVLPSLSLQSVHCT